MLISRLRQVRMVGALSREGQRIRHEKEKHPYPMPLVPP